MTDDELIARYIARNPRRSGLDEALITPYAIPVWAIVGYLGIEGADVARVAADYDIPIQAVEAALAYYGRHKQAIDARIAANGTDAEPASQAA